MKYFVQINKSTPDMMIAGEISKLNACEYCDTTTGTFDGIAKIILHKGSSWKSQMNKVLSKFGRKIDATNFELYPIRNILYFDSDEIRNNLPFWWLVKYPRPDEVIFRSIGGIKEVYLVDHSPYNLWIRGETKNNLELAFLEDSFFRKYNFGSNTTHLIFERFKSKNKT